MILRNIHHFFLISYKPVCESQCNHGKCVNNNLCSCEGTLFTGKNCDEYYKLKRPKIMNALIIVSSSILLGVIAILIILIIKYRKEPLIKSGKY